MCHYKVWPSAGARTALFNGKGHLCQLSPHVCHSFRKVVIHIRHTIFRTLMYCRGNRKRSRPSHHGRYPWDRAVSQTSVANIVSVLITNHEFEMVEVSSLLLCIEESVKPFTKCLFFCATKKYGEYRWHWYFHLWCKCLWYSFLFEFRTNDHHEWHVPDTNVITQRSEI